MTASEVSPLFSASVAFLIAFTCTPAGVSGAFLLLPYQFSVLGFTSPGVTPTNLLYNVFSTPGGILQFRAQGSLDRSLVGAILAGAVPGIVIGSVLRVTVLPDPAAFKRFVGIVLMGLGLNLLIRAIRRGAGRSRLRTPPRRVLISGLGFGAGVIGGIYGISGGSIIAPFLAGVFGFPVKKVAPAALAATLLTSVAGVASFQVIDLMRETGPASSPDWGLALLLGAGGVAGSVLGARLSKSFPETALRILLGAIAVGLGASYLL